MRKTPILDGKRFTKLVVLSCVGNKDGKYTRYRCRCDCGIEKDIVGIHLTSGNTKSCGCLRKVTKNGWKPNLSIVGNTYNNWIVLSFVGKLPEKDKYKNLWLCRCICGTETIINSGTFNRKDSSCGCLRGKGAGISAKNSLLSNYKRNAKDRNLCWNLTDEQAEVLFKGNCHYCGSEPICTKAGEKSNYRYNGIDRVNNNKGYTIKNCVSCCKLCNWSKRNLRIDVFLRWINKVHNHTIKKLDFAAKKEKEKMLVEYPNIKRNMKHFWEI